MDGLGDVVGGYCFTPGQVRNRPRDPEHAVVAAGGQAEAPHDQPEQVARVAWERAPAPDLAGAHAGVHAGVGPGEARLLARAGGHHPGADGGRGLAGRVVREVLVGDRRKLEVQVDPVEQGPGEPAEVVVALPGRAPAGLDGSTPPAARVGGGHELEAGREAVHRLATIPVEGGEDGSNLLSR